MNSGQIQLKRIPFISAILKSEGEYLASRDKGTRRAFQSMVQKEISDHVRSWRYIILLFLIFLTCAGSLYGSLSAFPELARKGQLPNDFFFLNLFMHSNGTIPPFFIFVGFLAPLLGISLGFDAVNSEHNKGTLSRLLAQPIPRDYVINAKFVAGVSVISVLFFSLSFLLIGAGLLALGIPPSVQEFLRIIAFTLVSILYTSFWLNLSILFSVSFRQAATSALTGIAVWLFFNVFYPLITTIILKGMQPSQMASPRAVYLFEKLKFALEQVAPGELFNEITSALFMPEVRSLSPLTMEQMHGAVPGALSIGQSILVAWPQLTGLLAITLLCFIISYLLFMRREIRSR